MAKKSLFMTYVLWLFGGVFGLHHFYLGRDFQALIWWMFSGGYFGIGLIRDLWRIPEYVKDANEDNLYMQELAEKMRKHSKPPSGTVRYFGQITVSDALGYLIVGALPHELIPESYHTFFGALLAPFGVAIGVYLVGNIGRHEGKFSSAVIGAYLTFPLYFCMSSPICLTSFAAISYFNANSKQWRRAPKRHRSLWKRVTFLITCELIFLLLCCSWFYFSCTMNSENGEVKCRDAVKHFFKSRIWKEFVSVIKEIWQSGLDNGWWSVWKELQEAFDPHGEVNALHVLGLTASSSQQEISMRYRKLSRDWHPDKHKDPAQKQLAQEKFIEIQQAYEILSNIKSRRVAKNDENRNIVQESIHHEEL